ncbi:unnamed protein product [Paramecium pentaurelia]|uniref:SAYSvFN domain-containing protein n=1 Tax=Paramecium pentaurelia TaxID=43138 RepID=A0A8S1V9P3_9CILI|nr:unnamed protein product [Paramecium pentaurelia]
MYKVELVDSSEFKDRSKYYKHLLQTYFQWSFLKYFVYTIIWLIGGRISILYSMQGLYVIITGFALIFTNLGTREKGTLSAYSIFNKGYKKLMGQMTEEDVANMYNMGGVKKKKDDQSDDDDDDKISKDFEGLSMEQMMAKLSKLGNKQCFCNSGRKYKKCHYYIHQRIKQQEDEDRRKGIKQN